MKYLCSICMLADADTIAPVEGFTGIERARPVCWPCLSPEPVPDPARYFEPVDLADRGVSMVRGGNGSATARVLEALGRIREGTTAQLMAAMGIEYPGDAHAKSGAYGAVSQAIWRAYRSGAIEGEYVDPTAPRQGRIYRLPRRAA